MLKCIFYIEQQYVNNLRIDSCCVSEERDKFLFFYNF